MGIHANFTGDFTAVDLRSLADDMLSEVVADHAAQRFAEKARANAVVAGGAVPYKVEVNGRTVSRGQGEILPTAPLVAAMPARTASNAVVQMSWLWESLNGTALERAVNAFMRADSTLRQIESVSEFVRLVVNANDESAALFRFLFVKYVKYRYPRIGEAIGVLKTARRYYRIYRRVKLGQHLLTGSKSGEPSGADPAVLAWIAAELRDRSPVLSGAYRDAHALYGDGRFLMNAEDITENSEIPDAEEYSFTNTMPYSRKIEFGKTRDGRAFVIQVPDHLYERTAQDARSAFGDAEIGYELRAVIADEQTPQRAASGVHNNPDVRYPSIVVRFS